MIPNKTEEGRKRGGKNNEQMQQNKRGRYSSVTALNGKHNQKADFRVD